MSELIRYVQSVLLGNHILRVLHCTCVADPGFSSSFGPLDPDLGSVLSLSLILVPEPMCF